jgi:Gpi18-like mannosyltransferase
MENYCIGALIFFRKNDVASCCIINSEFLANYSTKHAILQIVYPECVKKTNSKYSKEKKTFLFQSPPLNGLHYVPQPRPQGYLREEAQNSIG